MITENNYLDLFNLWFNEIVGDFGLGTIVLVFLLTFVLIQMRQSLEIILAYNMLLLSILFAINTGLLILWIIPVSITGFIFYYNASKVVEQR